MTKLSESLTHERHPLKCQSCGIAAPPPPSNATVGHTVEAWMECDENDKPQQVYVMLCRDCSTQIIDPHPRLYDRRMPHEPRPGAMPTCANCSFRRGLDCTHPKLKKNGGPGLMLNFPQPARAHIYRGSRGSGWVTIYTAPVTCREREENANK